MPPSASFLSSLIDYAGLFPPASLPMALAVENYDRYRRGPDSWMLGRFILGCAHADAFRGALASLPPSPESGPWRLGVVAGTAGRRDSEVVEALRSDLAGRVKIDAIECAPATPDQVEEILSWLPNAPCRYVEVPLSDDPDAWLPAIQRTGAWLKIRTGSVVAEGIPDSSLVLRFLRAAVTGGVSFKATAGLHHPVRGTYPLTYAPDSPTAVMHGFLNLIAATALLHEGATDSTACEALEETDPGAFLIDGPDLSWRGRWLGAPALSRARDLSLHSFGSCSFLEPVEALAELAR